MSFLDKAKEFDRLDKANEAGFFYDKALRNNEGSFDDYLNASLLMFGFQDYGYSSHHKIEQKDIDQAWDKSIEYLRVSEEKFGKHAEVRFWESYYNFILLGESDIVEVSQELFTQGFEIPVIYLLPSDRLNERYIAKANSLFNKVKNLSTYKERYIKSILENCI